MKGDNPLCPRDQTRPPSRTRSVAGSLAKKLCKERDDWTCQLCGKKPVEEGRDGLEVHHKARWYKHPELRHNVCNMVTLCVDCHRIIHSRRGKRTRIAWERTAVEDLQKEAGETTNAAADANTPNMARS